MAELEGHSTRAPEELDKSETKAKFQELQDRMFKLQHLLYANKVHSVLIILQGLDAAGKDSTIRHVFSCINPLGCHATSFSKPTEEERSHDFLWRIYRHLPARGMFRIFNRSHYEDILVPTVHGTVDAATLEHRYEYINSFEDHLQRQGTLIFKFFLNLSEEKQQKKLNKRLSDPRKKWKYDPADKREQKNRSAYLQAYREIFTRCSPQVPWQIIPADQKWYRNYLIAQSVVTKLESLDMKYPGT